MLSLRLTHSQEVPYPPFLVGITVLIRYGSGAIGSLASSKPGSSGLLHVFTHSSRFYGVSLPGIGCPDAKMTSIRHTDALPEHGSGGRALEGASRAQGMLRIPCQLFSAAP